MGIKPGMDKAKAEQVTKNFQDTLTLGDGENLIRIVFGVEKIKEHWIPTTIQDRETGSPKPINKAIRCTETPDCPLCQAARAENQTIRDEKGSRIASKSSWLLLAIDREQQEAEKKTTVRLLKVPWTVWKALKDFQDNPNYGDMTQWDVSITRQENPKTHFLEYIVQPARQNTPFTEEELEAFDKCDLDLPAIAAPISVEEVLTQLKNYPINLAEIDKIKSPEAIAAFFRGINHVEAVSLMGRQGEVEPGQIGGRKEIEDRSAFRPEFGPRGEGTRGPIGGDTRKEEPRREEPRGRREEPRGRDHGRSKGKDEKGKAKKRPF